MREMIKMVVVLTVLSTFSGGILAAIKTTTKERIEYQQLTFVKGPAIKKILDGAENDPIVDRFKILDGDIERSFFVGIFNGKANSIAFESFGKGFGGDVGVMIGINIKNDNLLGSEVTTHSETPGLGSKAKTDPDFSGQFIDKSSISPINLKQDGGQIDAIAGATITSRAVCMAATDAGSIYKRLKPKIIEKLKDYSK
jgi:electron transport complex protein RnfG